jgi:U32 family peptidase
VPNLPRPPELLLPAGSFDSALAAIDGGADALYLGFTDFSARKGARNFGRLEYRRLYRLARDRGIKLYVALNTVILQEELEAAATLLAFLGRFPPDAVIVQDWGLARIIKDRHPGIAIHASTQAAVQGSGAARLARELGASRIVLPRETSLAEMASLVREEPSLEYETFVHGALCYSFSGLCLASGLVLGRSGNRGECAQLCRSYYRTEDRPPEGAPSQSAFYGHTGYWFSCRDLSLEERVGELAAAGIASLKVEGRMKSPEYCHAVASLYRGILDGLGGAGPGAEEIAARREAASIAFSRSPTEAWLQGRGGSSLIDADYPGHRGVAAGRIVSNLGGRLVVDLESPLGLRDGLLGFDRGDPSSPVKFSVLELRDAKSGRDTVSAAAGARVELRAESDGLPCLGLRAGDELRRISARELDRRKLSQEEYEAAKEDRSLRLSFGTAGLEAELSAPGFDGRFPASGQGAPATHIPAGSPLVMDKARAQGGLAKALAIFDESGEADFHLRPLIDPQASVELPPGPDGLPRSCLISELFIPPSVLKREKNRIYSRAAAILEGSEIAYALESITGEGARGGARASGSAPVPTGGLPTPRPPRAALVFPREGLATGMPFATARDLAQGATPPMWGGRSWLPLAPLVFDREAYALLVERRAAEILASGACLSVGLGALHHFATARRLRALFPESGGRLSFFLDFNLYIANHLAWSNLSSLVEGVEFAYRYLEIDAESPDTDECHLAPIGPGFEPPLFQSLGCFLKAHLAQGRCPSPCGKTWTGLLSDRDRRYRVLVEDCVTMLFRTSGGGSTS